MCGDGGGGVGVEEGAEGEALGRWVFEGCLMLVVLGLFGYL